MVTPLCWSLGDCIQWIDNMLQQKASVASKNSLKPCGSRSGSVSIALLTTSLCPFLPHAAARGGRSAHKHPSTTNARANLNKYPGLHKSNIHSLTCTFNDSLPRIWMQVLIFTTVYFFPQEAVGKAKSRLKFRTPMLPKTFPANLGGEPITSSSCLLEIHRPSTQQRDRECRYREAA